MHGDLLGHADGGETARAHYVQYKRGSIPLERHPGELEVDLLERVTGHREVTPGMTPATRESS